MFIDNENTAIVESVGSTISQNMRITGTIISSGMVTCAGQIDGTVQCKSFHILPGGKLSGEITADEVTIAGIVIGNVRAESIKLSKQADVNGDLCCSSIAIEEGARIEASLSKDQVQNG